MNNDLTEQDQKKIVFLIQLAKLILKQLNVRYTNKYLGETITQSYNATFNTEPVMTGNSLDFSVADKDDPLNLAIVLTEAVKKYHIKCSMTEIRELTTGTATLIIFKSGPGRQSYPDMLAISDNENDEVFFMVPGLQRHQLSMMDDVDSYIAFTKSGFTAEPGYILQRNQGRIRYAAIIGLVFLATLILFLSVKKGLENGNIDQWLPALIISLMGMFICFQLFYLEKNNRFRSSVLKRFCADDKKGFNCRGVLLSNAAKLFGIISMTDIGSIYFTSIFLSILYGLLTGNLGNYIPLLFWGSLIPLPYTIFSVYYQLKVIKRICVLCLSIQGLLWVQFAYYFFISQQTNVLAFDWLFLIGPLTILSIVATLFFLNESRRKLVIRLQQLSLENISYKNDPDINDLLINRTPAISKPAVPGINIGGHKDSPAQLTVIISPLCRPCGKMLSDLLKLADWFGDDLLITVYIKPYDPAKHIFLGILACTIAGDHQRSIDLLTNWYRLLSAKQEGGTPDIDNITGNWKENLVNDRQEEAKFIYQAQEEWFEGIAIPHTPLLIYNNHYLPTIFYDPDTLRTTIEKKLESVCV